MSEQKYCPPFSSRYGALLKYVTARPSSSAAWRGAAWRWVASQGAGGEWRRGGRSRARKAAREAAARARRGRTVCEGTQAEHPNQHGRYASHHLGRTRSPVAPGNVDLCFLVIWTSSHLVTEREFLEALKQALWKQALLGAAARVPAAVCQGQGSHRLAPQVKAACAKGTHEYNIDIN